MKHNKSLAIVYYLCAIIWFAMSIYYFVGRHNSSNGIVYLSVGVMWLIIGGAYAIRLGKEAKTIKYYEENAEAFVEATDGADLSECVEKFCALIPKDALILDWGCGGGRDTATFLEAGYRVEAIDASEHLCEIASERTGIEVKCQSFEDLTGRCVYDGIWACASLLHLDRSYITEALELAKRALKPGGAMFISFKYGDFEGLRRGRFFTDMTEKKFRKCLKEVKRISIVDEWITDDPRERRPGEQWYNVLLVKDKQ